METLRTKKVELSNSIIALEDSLKFFDKVCALFNKETERHAIIKGKKTEKNDVEREINSLKNDVEEEKNTVRNIEKHCRACEIKISDKKIEIQKSMDEIHEKDSLMKKNQKDIDYLKENMKLIRSTHKTK